MCKYIVRHASQWEIVKWYHSEHAINTRIFVMQMCFDRQKQQQTIILKVHL